MTGEIVNPINDHDYRGGGEISRRLIYLEIASEISQRVTSNLDLATLLDEAASLIRMRLGFFRTLVYLADEDSADLVLQTAACDEHGGTSRLDRGFTPPAGSPVVRSALKREAVLCRDSSSNQHPNWRNCAPGAASELAIPLRFGRKVIGVLDVQSDHEASFCTDDVPILQLLGDQLATAILNARLLQETRSRFEAMVALHSASLNIISRLDKGTLLRDMLRRGARLLGVNVASIFLFYPEEGLIRNIANFNTRRDWTGTTLRPGEGVTGQVIATGAPLIVNDYERWPGKAPLFAGTPNPRVMGAPLLSKGRVIGALVVDKSADEPPFTKQDLWLLGMFADMASIAIQNADLHLQVKNLSEDLERRVIERTGELEEATNEIIKKAEQLKALLSKTTRIQDEERARIARDVHDGFLQLLTATRYEIKALEDGLERGDEARTAEGILAIRQLLDQMGTEVRRVINDLHPPMLDVMGLESCLRDYAGKFHHVTGLVCDLRVKGEPFRLPLSSETSIFHLVLEGLQNIVGHADATAATVMMEYGNGCISIEIEDNGRGFDAESWTLATQEGHYGLASMRERAESLGGVMVVQSAPGRGTHLNFTGLGRDDSTADSPGEGVQVSRLN